MKEMSKKEKIMVILLIFLILLFIFVILFVVANKDNNEPVLEVPDYFNDVNNYIYFEEIDETNYNNLYKSVNLKKVKFKNVSELLYGEFDSKQEGYINLINNNIEANKNFIESYNIQNNITNYSMNSYIDSIILYEINDGVISLLYLIEDNVDYIGLNNYIYSIFIDVKNNSIISNEDILEKYGKNMKEVSGNIFDNFVSSIEEENIEDILNNKEEYVNIISDNFYSYVYLYVYEGNLYLKYNKSDMNRLLFDNEVDNVKYSTLKV